MFCTTTCASSFFTPSFAQCPPLQATTKSGPASPLSFFFFLPRVRGIWNYVLIQEVLSRPSVAADIKSGFRFPTLHRATRSEAGASYPSTCFYSHWSLVGCALLFLYAQVLPSAKMILHRVVSPSLAKKKHVCVFRHFENHTEGPDQPQLHLCILCTDLSSSEVC